MYCGLTSPDWQGEAQGMVDGALPALRSGQPSSGRARPARIDSPAASAEVYAERAEGVGIHVPDGFLGRVPFAVGMRPPRRLCSASFGRGTPVKLVGDVVVLVPNDQVRIAALALAVTGPVQVRPILVIAFDDRIGRHRHRRRCRFRRDSC